MVRDKDGISAALVMAQLAAAEKAAGRTPLDRLEDIARRFGAHATDQITLELEGPGGVEWMQSITDRAPCPAAAGGCSGVRSIASTTWRQGCAVAATGARSRSSCPVPTCSCCAGTGVRVVVRPSGTEPKLKAYLEVVADTRAEAAAALGQLHAELAELVRP